MKLPTLGGLTGLPQEHALYVDRLQDADLGPDGIGVGSRPRWVEEQVLKRYGFLLCRRPPSP